MGGDGDGACHGVPRKNLAMAAWLTFRAKEKTYDTHALPGSNECCNTNHEANGRQYSPASTSVTESDENGTDNTTEDSGNT